MPRNALFSFRTELGEDEALDLASPIWGEVPWAEIDWRPTFTPAPNFHVPAAFGNPMFLHREVPA